MNTLAVKQPQIATTNSKIVQDRIYAALETGKKQLKKLSWLFERHPGFIERNAWDKDIKVEVRRMRF